MALRQRTPMFSNSFVYSAQSLALRGPKKKKPAGPAAAPDTTDIVNIWKERPDPKIYPSERYPPWLIKMVDEHYTGDDVVLQIYRGERIPADHEQWSLAKAMRREYMIDENKLRKDEWHYESEDDEGEDVGKFNEDEAEGADAEGGEKKEGEEKKEGGAAAAGGEGAKKEGGDKKEGGGEAKGKDGDKK